jgi:hypothetical protein
MRGQDPTQERGAIGCPNAVGRGDRDPNNAMVSSERRGWPCSVRSAAEQERQRWVPIRVER